MPNVNKYALTGLLLLSAACACRADVVVVVSAKSPASTLNAEEAADIFLGNVSTFPSGAQAVPIDQSGGSPLRDEFYGKVTGKTPAQLKAHWSKIVFTGKGRPPKEAGDSMSIKKLVAENPNMIGYIDKAAVDSTVKVLMTVR